MNDEVKKLHQQILNKYESYSDEEFYTHFRKWAKNEFTSFDDYLVYVDEKVQDPKKSINYNIYLYFQGRIKRIQRDIKLNELL